VKGPKNQRDSEPELLIRGAECIEMAIAGFMMHCMSDKRAAELGSPNFACAKEITLTSAIMELRVP
jgi:hypothetical protein